MDNGVEKVMVEKKDGMSLGCHVIYDDRVEPLLFSYPRTLC